MWLWIGLYLIIAIFLFRKNKLALIDFVWVLLPIQFYGIDIGPFLLKPYMLFTIAILLKNGGRLSFDKRVVYLLSTYFVLQILVDLINDSNMQSYLNQGTYILVVICALIYENGYLNEDGKISIDNTIHAIILSGVAYGLITLIVFAVHSLGITLPGIIAHSRSAIGFFLERSSMVNDSIYIGTRYRGFTGDPNLVTATLILPCVLSVYCLNRSTLNRFRNFAVIILSVFTVFITNSRTGIIALCFAMILSYLLIGKRKGLKLVIFVCFAIALGVWYSFSDFNILSLYDGRSSLTSSHGRLTIWSNAITTLNENNPLFGIGSARLASSEYQSIYCHNTWLEWICGNGWLFGVSISLFFMFEGLKKYRIIKLNNQSLAYSLLVGYYSIWLTMLTVDDIANVSLLYLLAVMTIVIKQYLRMKSGLANLSHL